MLASAALADRERRLVDLLAWYAEFASTLLSVQRTRTLANELPHAMERLTWFARWAVTYGGDRRWSSIASESEVEGARRGKGPTTPRLDAPATLMFRLRAGFGVGVKADLLTFLVCGWQEDRSAVEIADAIGYTDKTVRIALRDLRLAEFVEEAGGYPLHYAARPAFARSFFESLYGSDREIPEWCYCAKVFSFLQTVAAWTENPDIAGSPYLASSHARDLFERYEATFRTLHIRMPRPETYPGSAYLSAFADFVLHLETRFTEARPDRRRR